MISGYNEVYFIGCVLTPVGLSSGIFVRDIEVELWFFIWNMDSHSF